LGGAGLAARRLNQGLIKSGIDSSFHAFAHSTFDPSNGEVPLSRSIVSKYISKFITYLDLKLGKKVFFSLFNHTALNFDYFVPYKDRNTILHFHNFFNLTSLQTILKLSKIGYNVVVTLHDQRLFTGGCHYAFDCKGFESVCKNCPQAPITLGPLVSRNMRRSRKLAALGLKLFVIAPSRWMQDQVIKSQIVPPAQIRYVPNSLGPNFSSGLVARKSPSKSGKYILGIASMDTNSFIKGGDLVDKLRIESKKNQLPLEYVSMRDYEGENVEENFWGSIDCLLVLSRADNSPNVIHEAKNFGIPIVGNAVGGITELLDPNFDFLVNHTKVQAEQIYSYLENLNFSVDFVERQSRMMRKFDDYVGASIEEHLNIYKFILESHK
jgi:glycosyltransferase involved in cell wall biosynthesis